MIRLTYAHRWTTLVDAMAEHLTAVRAEIGPLAPLTVVVPHTLASAYLKMALADRLGIAANLRFAYLRPYLTETYENDDRRLLTPPRLEHLLLATLQALDDDPGLAPVARYLEPPPRDNRRAQLARTLTGLFDEYGLSRPQMLSEWSKATHSPGRPAEDHADGPENTRWQAVLWRRLRAFAEDLDGPALLTLDEVVRAGGAVPSAVFVFDVLLGSSVLQSVLGHWAQSGRVEVYATNPCMEFWEDLPAGGRAARQARARMVPRADGATTALDDGEDPLALVLWGRPGRENIRQLNQLTDCDFDGRFDTEPRATVLGRLQQDILHRASPTGAPAPDDSIVVLACPGARREAEVIVESIWSTVAAAQQAGEALSFGDIGIVLAGRDRDAYRSHFAAVFEEYHQLPHHFVDVPVARGSRVIEAIELLLALPTSRYTRQDMLRLLTHPTVLPTDDSALADEWAGWCDDLAIVHGADHRDHAGTYIEDDLLNWDQGLSRLTTGLFVGVDDPDAPAGPARRPVPYNTPFDRTESAAQLVTLARSLIADARFMRDAVLSMRDWAELLRLTCSAYITPRDDADERDLLRILGVLEKLEADDLTGTAFPFPVVEEHMHTAIADLTENIGQPLADGVIVAPLRLAAHLPLRVVYLPGLNEGAFPTRDLQSHLDVRWTDPKPGEIQPRERDQYQFLTRLLATEDQVVLSYVARDASTGDVRTPAPTLVELMRMLVPYVGDDPESVLMRRPPLRRYDDEPHAFASSATRREAETRHLRATLAPGGLGPTPIERLKQRLGTEAWRRLTERLGLIEPPSEPVALPDTVTLRAIRLFLEDPLQGWVHHTLGLRAETLDDDQRFVVDERFRTDALHTHVLLRKVLLDALRDATSTADVYAEHADQLEVQGIVPTGLFKRAERERHLRVLDGWQRALRKVFANRPRPLDPFRFGPATAASTSARPAPTFTVDEVELRGTTQPAIEEPPASVVLRVGRRPTSGPALHDVAGFVDHVARSAVGLTADKPYVVWAVYGDGQTVRTRFDPFAQTEAQDYLATLVAQMRTEAHDYLLPFAAVDRAHRRGDLSDDGWASVFDTITPPRFGPLAGVRAAPPSTEVARDILTERFGPFYRKRHEETLP